MTDVVRGIAVESSVPSVHFRMQFTPVGYGCLERSGSLKPVPPGQTRRSMGYCQQCQAGACLFPNGYGPAMLKQRTDLTIEVRRRTGESRAIDVHQRSRGCGRDGRPLIRSCWNCRGIRQKDGGFVCLLEARTAVAASQCKMACHTAAKAAACDCFWLREDIEIPPVPADKDARGRQQATLRKQGHCRRMRRQGLSYDGRPLTHCCWNCHMVRRNGAGYVCEHQPQARGVARQTMCNRHGCQHWALRTEMEVLPCGS